MRFAILMGVFLSVPGLGTDKFPSFSALARAKTEGRDFRVVVKNRKSPITALAIHGGAIEFFTEKLAEAFAGSDLNLYTFEALTKPAWDLHITSTHFDDKRAVDLVSQSDFAVAFHGEKNEATETLCVGGSYRTIRTEMAIAIRRAFPEIKVEVPCARLPGIEPNNITNLGQHGGVQLEFSMKLLKALRGDYPRSQRIIQTLRATVEKPADPSRLPQSLSRPPPTKVY